MKQPLKPSRRLVSIQMNLGEINALPPTLRARVIDRAARKSLAKQPYKHKSFLQRD